MLWDGVPINDPFGGWVYWTRISPQELDRIEISRGASTSVFGDRAMAGTIALFSRPIGRWLWASYEGGNRDTHSLSGRRILFVVTLRRIEERYATFTTDGYFIVPENRRGTADTPANVRFISGNTRLDFLNGTSGYDSLFVSTFSRKSETTALG